jgi:hypothetical protein
MPTPETLLGVKDTVDALNDRVRRTRLRFFRGEGDTVVGWMLTRD